ncbi:MAG: glycerate dehydrogenase, partial [Thermomicrobiales bacterium]
MTTPAKAERHTIVFLDRAAFKADFCPPGFPHDWINYPHTSPEQVIDRTREASIVITCGIPITAATI